MLSKTQSQAAADNQTVGSAQPSQPVPTRSNNYVIFSWSNFQKESGMAQRDEDGNEPFYLTTNIQ